MPKQLMLYIPVIHSGYEQLVRRHGIDSEVLLIGSSFANRFPVIRKEIRALSPERVADYIRTMHDVLDVRVIEEPDLPDAVSGPVLVLPDEDVMRSIAKQFGLGVRAELRYERTFLRWDRTRTTSTHALSFVPSVTTDQVAKEFGRLAQEVGYRSSDWWRQVGAIAARSNQILATAYNEHLPSEYAPYINGDPRSNYRRGLKIEISTALHAEAALVARCAKEGTSLSGADLYVSTFPCPPCARLIAEAGFSRCFFADGYSMLDGEGILRAAGVELFLVHLDSDAGHQLSFADVGGWQSFSSTIQ
jgi:dCMP deaminase